MYIIGASVVAGLISFVIGISVPIPLTAYILISLIICVAFGIIGGILQGYYDR